MSAIKGRRRKRLSNQLEQIAELAYKGGQDLVAYISMAFGNPYGDAWDIDEVVSAVDLAGGRGGNADFAGVIRRARVTGTLIRDVM